MAVRMLALRQPMAQRPARRSSAALKIASDLERIGDYATNVAKRAIALDRRRRRCSRPSQHRRAWRGWRSHDQGRARRLCRRATPTRRCAVWQRDEELDEMYTSLFRELLTYMMEDPRNITRLHAPAVHRQEHRAHRRPRHQHRRDRLFPGARRAARRRRGPRATAPASPVEPPRRRPRPRDGAMKPAHPRRRGRGGARRRCCATTSRRRASASPTRADGEEALLRSRERQARPRAARLDAAAGLRHRGLPPAPPHAGDAQRCRSSC